MGICPYSMDVVCEEFGLVIWLGPIPRHVCYSLDSIFCKQLGNSLFERTCIL